MSGFTDIHHHLLYGLDDGPSTYEEMTDMLKAASANGIETLIATPHISPGMRPFNRAAYDLCLQEARAWCSANAASLTVLPGAEILYTPLADRAFLEGKVPTLAGTQYVLVEFMPDVSFAELSKAVRSILGAGYLPILAHMERYRCLMRRVSQARRLKDEFGVLYQVNASTILDGYDFWTDRSIGRLLKDRAIDFIATDAHNTSSRPCRMRRAYAALRNLVGDRYAATLTGRRRSPFKADKAPTAVKRRSGMSV